VVRLKALLGCYSDLRVTRAAHREPVYVAEAAGEPVAADDARNLAVFDPSDPAALASITRDPRGLSALAQHRRAGAAALP